MTTRTTAPPQNERSFRHDLCERIRGEYREMPGLHLTVSQAGRLWHEDAEVCRAVLDQLVVEGFLHRTRGGGYLTLSRA